MCVFSSHPFWTSSSLDVPAGVTQEEGHTGFLIHLPSAVRALIFVARRIQPFLSLVDREVEFLPYYRIFSIYYLTYSRWTSSLPSCLWSLRIFPSLPGSRLTIFYRDASSALLQLVNQWLNFEFYLLTFPRFPLRKKEHKFYFVW